MSTVRLAHILTEESGLNHRLPLPYRLLQLLATGNAPQHKPAGRRAAPVSYVLPA